LPGFVDGVGQGHPVVRVQFAGAVQEL
jgi:hypothetical protein